MNCCKLRRAALALVLLFVPATARGELPLVPIQDEWACGFCTATEIDRLVAMLGDPVLREVVCRLSSERFTPANLSSALGLPEGQVWGRINRLRRWGLVRMVRRDSATDVVEPMPGAGEQSLKGWAFKYCPQGDECGRPVASDPSGKDGAKMVGTRGGGVHERSSLSSDGSIESVNAVTLATHDMRRAVYFYRALGFEIVKGGVDAEFTSFRVGKGYLNLSSQPDHRQWSWWGRVIFHVADVDALYRRAVAKGLHPETVPSDAEWGERYFHIVDPDNHELSFARPLDAPKR